MLLKPEYKNNINNEKEIKKYKITDEIKNTLSNGQRADLNLRHILGQFSLYIKYRKIADSHRTYTHVCLNKSRMVDFSI